MSLKDWAEKHKTYLKLEENEPISCRFKGYEEFVDHDNDDKEKVRYFLEINGDEKVLESQSIGLAEAMGDVKEGDFIEIKRTGQGRNTRYEVKILPDPNVEISDEDDEKITGKAKKDKPF